MLWLIVAYAEQGRKVAVKRLDNEKFKLIVYHKEEAEDKKDITCFERNLHSFCSNLFYAWFLKYFQVFMLMSAE